ncbi:MAG: DUF3320 domain-containing protein [Candidatus Taylorbacteria bacterium]|nr:DUF3320 domain-containing protein [Candidatus Taylorbacteria bacterium]
MTTTDSVSDKIGIVLKRWQERLIDVSKSNPLLGLNRSRAAKLELNKPDLSFLLKKLYIDDSFITLPFVQKKINKKDLFSENDSKEDYILHDGDIDFIFSTPKELRGKIRKIFDNSKTTLTERGVNTLYLTIGCLEWEDPLMGKSESPLIMIPCSFESKGSSKALNLIMADEDVVINPAIKYYLQEREEIEIPDILHNSSKESLPEENQLLDDKKIDEYLSKIESLVKLNGWKVTRRSWLGVFSFETLAIYQDLKSLDSQARTNPLIQAIAHLRNDVTENLKLDSDLDALETPEKVPVSVVEMDSSQLRALTLSSLGSNLVIHGPPGTGKSQTITAIIANALGQKKKVLFVSSKMAALNVVHNRLQQIGFGPFCLEAHGVKSGKRKVVDELKKALEINEEIKVAPSLDEDISKLVETRSQLNDYSKSVYNKDNPLGIHLFSAYGRYETLKDVELIKTPMPWINILDVSKKELEYFIDILSEVDKNAMLLSERDKHPLKGMKSEGLNLAVSESIYEHLSELAIFSESLNGHIEKISNFVTSLDLTIPVFISSIDIFKELSEIQNLPFGWNVLGIEDLELQLKKVTDLSKACEAKINLHKKLELLSSSDPENIVSKLNLFVEKYKDWYSRLSLKYWKEKKAILPIFDKLKSLSYNDVLLTLNFAKEIISLDKDIVYKLDDLNIKNKTCHIDLKDIGIIRIEIQTAINVKNWVNNIGAVIPNTTKFNSLISSDITKLVNCLNENKETVLSTIKEINNYWPNGFLSDYKIETLKLSDVVKYLNLLLSGLNQKGIREHQVISRIITRCHENKLLPFLEKIGNQNLEKSTNIFKKRFYSLWIDAVIYSKPILSEFSQITQLDLISKFRILDERITRLSAINLSAEPAQIARQVKIAHANVGGFNGVGILRKEMEKKKKLKPLRVLFNEIPQVLQALKPCFLMSPLSVSTFLKPGTFNFDIVIFDEASQLPTPEAIPSILRAKQVIVAGDSKQLPPTSFFRTNILDDSDEWDEQQSDELESLLDDCKASVPAFTETDLKWHYRSRNEGLINFSNHYYYNNQLTTFPTPFDNNYGGVISEYVPDGVWDRGGSRINRKEARHTAGLIIKHFKTEPEKTLGVVALNSSQKEAIQEALEEELQQTENKEFVSLMDPERTNPFFIKSLENVQGDERDVIMISIGYGKASDGKMTLNFGPINTSGGWRRLNVLVTRAKWKTVLITSIRSSDLVGINPENLGAIGLKNYIQYAETGFLSMNREAPRVLNEETNDFEDSVRKELEMRGFEVDAQVGVGSFKIDLAIRDKNCPKSYVLGIECDGATYHSSKSARDRDILRQEILQAMGWKLYRVWSTEWFRNREQAVQRLVENVNLAVNNNGCNGVAKLNKSNGPILDQNCVLTEIPARVERVGKKYEKSSFRINPKDLMVPSKNHNFSHALLTIIEEEGPIHQSVLLERVRELSKIGRVGSNINNNFNDAIKRVIKEGYVEKNKSDKGFLYLTSKEYASFRVPADENFVRHLGEIPAIEIKNAIKFLIKNQFGLAYDNAIQSIKLTFQVSRVDPEESDRIKDIIDEMLQSGIIVKHGPLLNLVSSI